MTIIYVVNINPHLILYYHLKHILCLNLDIVLLIMIQGNLIHYNYLFYANQALNEFK